MKLKTFNLKDSKILREMVKEGQKKKKTNKQYGN